MKRVRLDISEESYTRLKSISSVEGLPIGEITAGMVKNFLTKEYNGINIITRKEVNTVIGE